MRSDVQVVVDRLAEVLGRSVTLRGADDDFITYSGLLGETDERRREWILTQGRVSSDEASLRDFLRERPGPLVRMAAERDRAGQPGAGARRGARTTGDLMGGLSVIDGPTPLTAPELELVLRAARELSRLMRRDLEAAQRRSQEQAELTRSARDRGPRGAAAGGAVHRRPRPAGDPRAVLGRRGLVARRGGGRRAGARPAGRWRTRCSGPGPLRPAPVPRRGRAGRRRAAAAREQSGRRPGARPRDGCTSSCPAGWRAAFRVSRRRGRQRPAARDRAGPPRVRPGAAGVPRRVGRGRLRGRRDLGADRGLRRAGAAARRPPSRGRSCRPACSACWTGRATATR